MTVAELIAQLEKFPPHLPVMFADVMGNVNVGTVYEAFEASSPGGRLSPEQRKALQSTGGAYIAIDG